MSKYDTVRETNKRNVRYENKLVEPREFWIDLGTVVDYMYCDGVKSRFVADEKPILGKKVIKVREVLEEE